MKSNPKYSRTSHLPFGRARYRVHPLVALTCPLAFAWAALCVNTWEASGRDVPDQSIDRDATAQVARGFVDCNDNGIPDGDDIENCAGDPSCDDCNRNEIPDACDITSGNSPDIDMDGVPDECVFFDGGGADDDWETPENWDDDEVPNNLDLMDDESVTIEAHSVILDLEVEVDSLRLLDGATLNVIGATGEDFDVEELGGILIGSDGAIQSQLLLGDGRRVSVEQRTITIRSGGVIAAAAERAGGGRELLNSGRMVQAQLEAGNVLIESRCGEPIPGEMSLSGQMVADVFGNVVIDATQDCVACALCTATDPPRARGGETPPILCVKEAATLRVGADLVLRGSVRFCHSSSVAIEVGGSFVNESTCPECIQITGPMILGAFESSGGETVAAPHQFEVAGRDLGPVADGFNTNFSHATLEVAEESTVGFVDVFPNSGSGGMEALYVDTLILRTGASITIADSRVYYNTLIDEGASISITGGGSFTRISNGPQIPTVSMWGIAVLVMMLLAAGTLVFRSSRVEGAVRRHE